MPESANDTKVVYTVEDWLFGCVNFAVPHEGVDAIFAERCVDPTQEYAKEVNVNTGEGEEPKTIDARLLKADLLKWIVLGAGRITDTKDQDNGWAHAGGGYTLSKDDKKLLMDEANAIYEELEPESVFGKKKIRMRSAGIMPAYRDVDGTPLPRKPL
jgi:hypothetical protein